MMAHCLLVWLMSHRQLGGLAARDEGSGGEEVAWLAIRVEGRG